MNWKASAAVLSALVYVGYSAFVAGVMANAWTALSPFGVAVIGATAPIVSTVNMFGGNMSGADLVPPILRDDLFEFGADATRIEPCTPTPPAKEPAHD